MKVLLVAGAFAPNRFGSPAVLAEQAAIGLRARGHEVVVLAAMAGGAGGGELSRWEVSGVPVLGAAVPGPLHMDKILDVLQPDVVHTYSARFLGPGPARRGQQRGIPSVISVGGRDVVFPADLLRGADRILVAGPGRGAELVSAGLPAARVSVVVNGVVPPPAGWARPQHRGPLRIGYLGGMSEERGYQIALAALRELRRTDYELHVVDPATSRGVRAIREGEFRVPGLVRLLARFPPAVRDTFYGGIDVLLALPQDPGSACLAVREALLRGVWVIASDVEGASEVVRPGVNGTLVPAQSAAAVTAALRWVLDHREAVTGVAASGVPTVEDQVDGLVSVYQGALTGVEA